jgi:ribose transport system ATP-binding protein
MNEICLKTNQIEKHFGGVVALRDGSINVRSGEVLALVGANGSGKSTLTKIITGVLTQDRGTIVYHGSEVDYNNPMTAQKMGVMAVYQELSLVPSLTVAQNIWLANEPRTKAGFIDDQMMIDQTEELLKLFQGTYQSSLHPEAYVRDLPPDERQIVEILKAYSRDPEVLILDEATASLDSKQVSCLFDLIKLLKDQGISLVFVSHRMDEIFRIAERAVVLRNGAAVGEVLIKDTTEKEIVNMMIGYEEKITQDKSREIRETDGDTVLIVENLDNNRLNGVTFSVKQGELVGIGGLRGQGQSTLLHTLFGNNYYTGDITLFNTTLSFDHPREAMNYSIALIPGDRATEGLLLQRSIFENFHLPNWRKYAKPLLDLKKARKDAQKVSDQLSLVMESLESPVSNLSGGNAQKVVIGKWLLREPKLLLLDDPTKGVDVGTKAEFYKLLSKLQDEGTTILFYSSDEKELLDLCERVLVMQDGTIKADLSDQDLTEANLVFHSMGAAENNHHKESTHA